MRFLLDVNVGRRIAEALEAQGHDVVRAALTNGMAEDPSILAQAVEGGRVLITYDRDFSELVFSRAARTPPAIIYLRYRARDVEDAIRRLLTILESELAMNHMTVVDERRVRRTPFPTGSNDNA